MMYHHYLLFEQPEYRKGSGLKNFFIGALFVILVVAVTALAAMCYSYKLQLDSTREQLNKMAGNNTEETTAIVEDITSEITTQATTRNKQCPNEEIL